MPIPSDDSPISLRQQVEDLATKLILCDTNSGDTDGAEWVLTLSGIRDLAEMSGPPDVARAAVETINALRAATDFHSVEQIFSANIRRMQLALERAMPDAAQ